MRPRNTIKDIQTVDSLNIVTFEFEGIDLSMMSLELKDEHMLEDYR